MEVCSKLSSTGDGLRLLSTIKVVSFNFQSQKYLPHSLHEAKRRFNLCVQTKNMSVPAYLEQFQNILAFIERDPGIAKIVTGVLSLSDVLNDADERYLALAFLLGANRNCFGNLVEGLENDFLQRT
jgi:hypothetical protein